jgi:predicted DNA-binding transcriptional regulator AlpA
MARETLVTVAEVAEMTTLAESTLYDWRAKEKGPRSFKLNGRVVYIEREGCRVDRGAAGDDQPRR